MTAFKGHCTSKC